MLSFDMSSYRLESSDLSRGSRYIVDQDATTNLGTEVVTELVAEGQSVLAVWEI